jgi:hypothetical protein
MHIDMLEVHPAAELFPPLEGADFDELVQDIRANGLRTPILLDPDGRVRLRACRAAGVAPRFERWDGAGSPLDLVVSLNLRRRHLNESQRALLAAQLREQMVSGPLANLPKTQATEKAALLMSISPRSIRSAARILRSRDQTLISQVLQGDLPVSAAVEKLQNEPNPAPLGSFGSTDTVPILWAEPRWERANREALAALPVQDWAAPDAVLFLWSPDHALPVALDLLGRWGFRLEATVVSVRKPRAARLVRSEHDLILIAARGRPGASLRWSILFPGGMPGCADRSASPPRSPYSACRPPLRRPAPRSSSPPHRTTTPSPTATRSPTFTPSAASSSAWSCCGSSIRPTCWPASRRW